MSVLIACSTTAAKDYAFERWLDAVRATGCEALMVDATSKKHATMLRKHGVKVASIPPRTTSFKENFNLGWKKIVELADGHTHILSVESDIIVPPNIVDVMLENYTDCDFLRHAYPWRPAKGDPCYGMGCTLGTIELWRDAVATVPAVTINTWLYQNYRCKDIDILKLEHLID